MHESERLAFVFAVERAHIGKVLAEHEGFRQPLGCAFQLVLLEEELESLDAFSDVAHDLVGQRIDRSHIWREAARF